MVTITRDSDSVIFTFQDGDVASVKVGKDSNIDSNPLPGGDSNDNFIIDTNGANKTITINGFITPATSTRTSSGTTTTIAQQLAWLETLINGSQTGHTFSSTYQSSKIVFVQNIDYTEKCGNPNMVEFSITLIEGS